MKKVKRISLFSLGAVSLVLGSGCQSQQKKESLWDMPTSTEKSKASEASKTEAKESKAVAKIKANWRSAHPEVWYNTNPRIQQWRAYYNKTRDPWMLWEKSREYMPYIQEVFQKYGLPNELCLLPMVESSFNPRARSTNAAGLWQFVPGTGKDMGLSISTHYDERLNWMRSTDAAAQYLSDLANKFNGDWDLVLAAYNMGPGAIERALIDQGAKSYWQLNIREETMDYVPRFIAMLQLLRESYPKP